MLRRVTAEALDEIGHMGLGHEEEIVERLDLFRRYRGPVVVETDVLGVPGAIYTQPDAVADSDSAEVGSVGRVSGTVLSTGHHRNDIAVKVKEVAGEHPAILLPDQIRSVELDHPRRNDLPLYGRQLPLFGRVAASNGAIAFGQLSDPPDGGPQYRIETGTHSRYLGIGVVTAYADPDPEASYDSSYNLPSLEELKKMGAKAAAVFYMSKVISRSYVITSRMNGEADSQIAIPRLWEQSGPVVIDMTDMAANRSDGQLLSQHMQQFRLLKEEPFAQPTAWRSPFITDALFLRILEG